MLFNSVVFALFLPLVFAGYWSLARARLVWQNLFVLAASYLFYGWWDWRFLALIILSSLVDYLVGRGLILPSGQGRRRLLLGLSLGVNLGALGLFKYYGFFAESLATSLARLGVHADLATLDVVLPVGISFYTFQTLSYSIDVYRRRIEATGDWIAFFSYVAFFPQLVAGPIERAESLLPQFLRHRRFDAGLSADGLRQMLWGFVKKVVVADNLAPHVDRIFSTSDTQPGIMLVLASLLFAFQIYGDFSGYSDIAIGTARLLGFSLRRNFAFPYFSRNIAEFWRRWHISLSSWFRDYLFIPLGGSRCATPRRVLNVLLTFAVSGLWHGANWTFVAWGLLNGLYYLPSMLGGRHRAYTDLPAQDRALPRPAEALAIASTFLLTLLAWVFFRAQSIGHACRYLGRIVTAAWLPADGAVLEAVAWPLLLCLATVVIEWLQRDKQHALEIVHLGRPLRWTVYLLTVTFLLLAGRFDGHEFIYFQF